MRVLSVLALFFLPLSTVSSIFGTQFFTSTAPRDSGSWNDVSLNLNPKFWLLWAIAVPLTLAVLAVWILWERQAIRSSRDRKEGEHSEHSVERGEVAGKEAAQWYQTE
jgi:hypothetical protein